MRATGIIIKNNKILLIHRFWEGREYYVFPGGGQQKSETIEKTLKREIKEETNLEIISFKKFMKIEDKKYNRINVIFQIIEFKGESKLGGEESKMNSKENSFELEWHNLNEIKSLNLFPKELKQKLINTN